ncbi:MAG: HNH nuclease family protein [Candidatus Hydrogenedens sp.]|nr:HNH nuclease family protein [Candidatus Hydrogenedentota bacterium]NLF56195.1 HNH nuclease family protein [Candidatus Hydrogenedens sp.]
MPPRNIKPDPERMARLLASVRRDQESRDQGYRERAMKLFPHICGRCGREFAGKNLRELTVHHKDGDHMNNPPDGSNWELLCLYCHDAEHGTAEQRGYYGGSAFEAAPPPLGFQAFAGLKDLLPPVEEGASPPEEDK